MDSSMESVRVVIFGVEYSIKADVDIETTRSVAKYVSSKMSQIHESTTSRDHLKVAVLSALNIAGELFEIKARNEENARKISELQEKIASLNNKIDGALKT
jgi:cell division protein ZapA